MSHILWNTGARRGATSPVLLVIWFADFCLPSALLSSLTHTPLSQWPTGSTLACSFLRIIVTLNNCSSHATNCICSLAILQVAYTQTFPYHLASLDAVVIWVEWKHFLCLLVKLTGRNSSEELTATSRHSKKGTKSGIPTSHFKLVFSLEKIPFKFNALCYTVCHIAALVKRFLSMLSNASWLT